MGGGLGAAAILIGLATAMCRAYHRSGSLMVDTARMNGLSGSIHAEDSIKTNYSVKTEKLPSPCTKKTLFRMAQASCAFEPDRELQVPYFCLTVFWAMEIIQEIRLCD